MPHPLPSPHYRPSASDLHHSFQNLSDVFQSGGTDMESTKGTTLRSYEAKQDVKSAFKHAPCHHRTLAFSPWLLGRGEARWRTWHNCTCHNHMRQHSWERRRRLPTSGRSSWFAPWFTRQPLASSKACSPQTGHHWDVVFWEPSLLLLSSAGQHSDPVTEDLCPRSVCAFSISSSKS